MSLKYPSMQEELAARKADGAYGDLSEHDERFCRDEPEWVQKSREDAARSKRIANGGKRSLGTDREKSYTRKQKTPKVTKQKANRKKVREQAPQPYKRLRAEHPRRAPQTEHPRQAARPGRTSGKKAGCLIIALFFILFPLIGAIISAVSDMIHDFGTQYNYDYGDYDWDQEDDGVLDEYSSFAEAEDFIVQLTEPVNEDALYQWYYENGNYETLSDPAYGDAFADLHEGRLFIWAECSEKDDPEDVLQMWVLLTDDFRSSLEDAGVPDAPVAVIIKETESWDLRLVIVNGDVLFASGDYMNLGE